MSSPSILQGTPQIIKGNDGSLTCNFTAQFITLPASVGGIGYRLIAFLSCQSGTIQLNCVNNTTNQSVAYTRPFGVLQGPQHLWTSLDPPDGTILNGTVTLPTPLVCPAGSTQQAPIVTYVTVELVLQQNRIHNAVIQEIEHYVFQTVQVP